MNTLKWANKPIHKGHDTQSKKANVLDHSWALACASNIERFTERYVQDKRPNYEDTNTPTWQQQLLEAT